MKKIFTLCAMVLAFAANASAKYQLDLENLGNGWGSTYDAATKTITYEEEAWGGRGWGFGYIDESGAAQGLLNFINEELDYVIVKVKSSDVKMNLVAEYTDGSINENGGLLNVGSSSKAWESDETLLALPLNSAEYEYILQIYIQNQTWSASVGASGGNPAGTVVIEDAFLCSEAEYQAILDEQSQKPIENEQVIWEGERKFDSWTGFSISASKFKDAKVGSQLVFTLTELFDVPAQDWTYGAQILIKKSTWAEFDPAQATEHVAIDNAVPYELTYTIDEALLNEAQANGIVIQGLGFTVTKVVLNVAGDVTPPVPPVDKNLSLEDLGSGWGDSTYDAGTKTITIGDNWSGKGWWIGDKDASAYDYVVVKFAEPTATNGKIVVESMSSDNNGDDGLFGERCLQKVAKLAANCDHIRQVYIQGPEGAKYKLAEAYFASESDVNANGLKDEYAPEEDGIESVKMDAAQNGAIFNLAGQRVNNSYKGVVIKNGKKTLQ